MSDIPPDVLEAANEFERDLEVLTLSATTLLTLIRKRGGGPPPFVPLPTGGTITTSGSWRIHTFEEGGTFSAPSSVDVEYLLVAGGGSGAYDDFARAGGGGAGGYLSNVGGTKLTLAAGDYTIVVGDGGAAPTSQGVGNSGGDSTAFGLTALGGGGGGRSSSNGAAGGSTGGRGSSSGSAATATQPGSVDGGNGNNGGSTDGNTGGAGGGGAGTAGQSLTAATTDYDGGNGGDGLQNNITGADVYYAGGGGGSFRFRSSPLPVSGVGGLGGGGNGGTNAAFATDGEDGKGAGGGGGGRGSFLTPGRGGKGVVILRYEVDAPSGQPGGADPVLEGATYVSLAGSDTTGTGTAANPYRSLKKAAQEAVPGTTHTIYLRGGYYDVKDTDSYMTLGHGGEIHVSGTEAVPLTIRSYPGEWAIIDGINHPNWPRQFVSNQDSGAFEPRLIQFVGQWVNWERLEFRNSYGGGFRGFALDCKWRHCVFQNHHALGLDLQGSRNEIAYNLFQDCYSANNDGNSANGMFIRFSDQLTQEGRFPAETGSRNNQVHHNIGHNVSDDAFGANTSTDGIWEYNVAFGNGYGATGNGEGFKMGFSSTLNNGNVFRFNLSWDNKNTFNTNTSTGVLCHNNTAYASRSTSFLLNVNNIAGSGDNEAYNNLSLYPVNGIHRSRESGVTVHTHNAGYTGRWDVGGGEGNFDTSDLDPKVLSLDWTNPDFLRLADDSPYLNNGKVIAGGSTTLGAIPHGEAFAGGWDWRALLLAFPSHGLKSRSTMYPIAQT